MRLLYATENPAKLVSMRKYLKSLDIEIIGLMDMDKSLPHIKETGLTPLENAVIKAKAYYEAFKIPLFSCDSGLYFENLPDELSPKVNVRYVNGKCLTDDEMTEYYSGLAKKHGDIISRYRNAICLILDDEHIYTDFSDDLGGNKFIICDIPHPDKTKRMKGFPLDCLSKNIDSNEYYYDIMHLRSESTILGFTRFFISVINKNPDLFK